MHRVCRISQCGSPAAGHSNLCEKHKKAAKRNGDPLQSSIRPIQLKPYLRMVDARRARNPDSPLWETLEDRWRALVEFSLEQIRLRDSGHAYSVHLYEAAKQVHMVSGSATPAKVVGVVLALHLMEQFDRSRFQSDRSFAFQLVRAVRRLGPQAIGTRWCQAEKRSKGFYRDTAPRTTEVLAAWLRDAFGGAGAQLAALEYEAEAKRHEEAQAIYQAVRRLR